MPNSASFFGVPSVEQRLDKTNNVGVSKKEANSLLFDGLSTDDRLYITNYLMANDTSESSNDEGDMSSARPYNWSPMAQPHGVIDDRKRRMKKLRPTNAVALSLEDFSYIRPSWVSSRQAGQTGRSACQMSVSSSNIFLQSPSKNLSNLLDLSRSCKQLSNSPL